MLPNVERVLTEIDEYEILWRDAWNRIELALDSFAKGTSRVHEIVEARLSLITLAPEVFSSSGFEPTRHAAPFTAIGRSMILCIPRIPLCGGFKMGVAMSEP